MKVFDWAAAKVGRAKPSSLAILAALAGIFIFVVPLFVVLVITQPGLSMNPDSGNLVQQGAEFSTEGRDALVTDLVRATAAQGVCYGYRLNFNGKTDSASNLGPNESVHVDPTSCARWVELSVSVTWTSEASEQEDYGSFTVSSSVDLQLPTQRELSDAGLTVGGFVDAPAEATAAGVLRLPLLMTQHGLAPVEGSDAQPDADPADDDQDPLSDAGSDFWRDRMALVMGAAALLGAAIGLVIAAQIQRHRIQRPGAERR